MTLRNGGIRIFRVLGIQVYLHWSWLLAAAFLINWKDVTYSSPVWNVLEYLALFAVVLLHEFGHSLACLSVGGTADTIMLWPLGGVAYVSPPPRPGAMLWSIAAGPLVNVLLVPVTVGLFYMIRHGVLPASPDVDNFVYYIVRLNIVLLVFNILPIYPLDGGQIVWSLLWFIFGRWHSLLISCIIGLIGALGAVVLSVVWGDRWLVYLALFGAFRSWSGFQMALKMVRLNSGPKHRDYACPACGTNPPMAALWGCTCGAMYDTFATGGACPSCGSAFPTTQCTSCGARYPITQWYKPAFPVTMTNSIPTTTFTVPPPIRVPRL